MTKSYGFSTHGYNQIVVFSSEEEFNEIVAANPSMTAIIGADDCTKSEFPGVFIAGIMASTHTDRPESLPQAIRR